MIINIFKKLVEFKFLNMKIVIGTPIYIEYIRIIMI